MKGGTLKKQKEKVGTINYKVTIAKKFRDKIEEVIQYIDLIDPTLMKNLKVKISEYMDSPDE